MRTPHPSFVVAACVLAIGLHAGAQAAPKAQPDSRTGHGAAADKWYIKNTETVANCGGPVSSQVNPQTGATTTVCRVNGMVREVEKAPPGKAR
jgi:hypothetical protein